MGTIWDWPIALIVAILVIALLLGHLTGMAVVAIVLLLVVWLVRRRRASLRRELPLG